MRRAFLLLILATGGCESSGATDPVADAAPNDGGVDGPTTSDAAPDAAPSLPLGVNAIVLPNAPADGAPIPLYRLSSPVGGTQAIAFVYDGSAIEALDQEARSLWKKNVSLGALFGGFDVDGDGVPDLALVRSTPTSVQCFGKPLAKRSIDVFLGKDGTAFQNVVPPLDDICWSFGYATEQWSVLAALFGSSSRDLVLVPQYTSTNANAANQYNEGKAFVFGLDGNGFVKRGEMIMPTIPAYDAFPAAQPEPHGSGTDYYAASHVPNGLVTGGSLLFFTSGRAVQYAMKPPYALAADRPWLTANRKDLVGRNYGLVMPDPSKPERVALVAGTSAYSLWSDMRSGKMTADPYGGIERHVSVYDAKANTVDDRFFSYAHDGNDAFLYEGRTTFANTAWIAAPNASASRLVFDVYQGGHWHVHVTVPGATTTELDARDLFVWDARDLDGDGTIEVVASPSRDPSDPDVPGYYFVKWRTLILRWDEPTKSLVTRKTIQGALPWLVGAFRDGTRSSSGGFLYPVLTVAVGNAPAMVLVQPDGKRRTEAVP